jgi:CoA:oxalate CoA-transferase
MQVIELRGCLGVAWCARILADMGAEVLSIVPDRAVPAPRAGPPPEKWSGATAVSAHLDAGKSLVPLDPCDAADRESAFSLLAHTDVIVACRCWAEYDPRFDPAALFDRLARTVVAITPYGLAPEQLEGNAPDRLLLETELQSACGWTFMVGDPEREPLRVPAEQCQYLAGAYGATCCLAYGVADDRAPHLIDVAACDAGLTVQQGNVSMWDATATLLTRVGNRNIPGPSSVFACRDGFVCIAAYRWPEVARLMGRPDLADEPRYNNRDYRDAHPDEIESLLCQWTVEHDVD